MTAGSLELRYGVPGAVAFRDSPLGGAVAELRAAGGTAVIALRGGQALSYIPHGGAEVLWLSPMARLDAGKAVRGGIPVCWPWFGPHPSGPGLPAHGVARMADWDVVSAAGDAATARLCLGLRSPRGAAAQNGAVAPWQNLELTLTVTLGATLDLELTSHNHGETAAVVTQALHTYLRVGDVAALRIAGLDGRDYVDQLAGPPRDAAHDGVELRRQAGEVTITGEVDRIYVGTGDTVIASDPVLGRRIAISKQGSLSTVVWNPWVEKAARLGDLGPDGYRSFVCIETANAASDRRVVAPNQTHVLAASIAVTPL